MENNYKINDLVDRYNLTTRTLRFWEEKALLHPAYHTAGKRRVYNNESLLRIDRILHYKKKGLSLEDIKPLLDKEFKKNTNQKKLNRIRIVVDSTSSISEKFIEKYNLEVIPLYVYINEKPYLDGINITEKTFYEKLQNKNKEAVVKTAPPSIDDFIAAYSKLITEGAEVIYSLHISSIFSQTINNALTAVSKLSGIKIKVIDSRMAGHSLGMLAIELAKKINSGKTENYLDDYLQRMIRHNWQVVTVTSIKSLSLFGALNIPSHASSMILEQLLNFKPIFILEDGEGLFKLVSREDTLELSLSKMQNLLQNKISSSKFKIKKIGISYSKLNIEAENFKNQLTKYANKDILVVSGSAVLCAHLGAHSIGVAVLFDLD